MEPTKISEHLTPVIQMESRELQNPNFPPHVNSDELKFSKSIKTQHIIKRPVEELKEVLRLVMIKVGLRGQNWPVDEAKEVLLEHILSNYGSHTHDEIKLAFDLAIEGKLDVETNCYENFSCVYFSNIMNAYRLWAGRTYKAVVKELPKELEKKEDLSDKAMVEWWEDLSKKVRLENYVMEMLPVLVYDWKDKNGGIGKTAKEKNKYIKKATDFRRSKLFIEYEKTGSLASKTNLDKFNSMVDVGCLTGLEVKKVTDTAKRMILYEMLASEDNA